MMKTAEGPIPAPGILEISPYVGGKASLPGGGPTFKLSSNESPLGPSPKAVEAFKASAAQLHLYPDGSSAALKAAIAAETGLEAERLFIGAGSDEILSLLAQAYLVPGDEAIHTRHGFLIYPIATRANGGRPIAVAETRLKADVGAILEAVSPRTKIVFLANPNNPTGTYLTAGEVERLHAGLPRHVLLVLDAAYAEYVEAADYSAGEALVRRASNVVMTRTFSKIHGLAALRLGWAYMPPAVLDAVERIRGPFNASLPAQAAGVAAIGDRAHVAAARAHNTRWRGWLEERIARLGLSSVPSAGNFLLIDFSALGGNAAGAAAAADEHLKEQGLILRPVASYGLANCLRLSVGTAEANERVAHALETFVKGGRHG